MVGLLCVCVVWCEKRVARKNDGKQMTKNVKVEDFRVLTLLDICFQAE